MRASCKVLSLFLLVVVNNVFSQDKFRADTTLAYQDFQRGLQYESAGNYDSAIQLLTQAAVVYRKHRLIRQQVDVQNKLAYNLSMKGDIGGALKLVGENLDLCRRFLRPNSLSLADTYHQHGIAYYFNGSFREAISFFRQSLDIKEKALGKVHEKVASSINNLGILYETVEMLDTAKLYYDRYLDISLQLHGPLSRDVANAYNNLGGNSYFKGDYRTAIENYEKSLDIYKQVLPADHPELAVSYLNLGAVYNEVGEYQKALDYTMYAAGTIRNHYGEESPQYLNVQLNLGTIYASMGKRAEALQSSLAGYTTAENIYGPDNPSLAKLAMNIGTIYHEMGDFRNAITWQEKSLAINQRIQGDEAFEVGSNYNNLSNAYMRLKDFDQAVSYILKSIEIKKKTVGIHHQSLAFSYLNLSNIYFAQKKFREAARATQHGLIANHANFEDTTITAIPPFTEFSSAQTFGELLIQKASSLLMLYEETRDGFHLANGLKHLLAADSLLLMHQYEIDNEADLIMLSSELKRISAVGFMICSQLYKLSRDKRYLDRIFYFKERSRGTALRLAISQTQAGRASGLDPSIRERQLALQNDLSAYKIKLAQLIQDGARESDEAVVSLRTAIFSAADEYARMVKRIEQENPRYFELKYSSKTVTPADIQSGYLRQNPKAALVIYSIIDSALNILVVTPRGVFAYDTMVSIDIERNVRGLRNTITHRVDDKITGLAETLYTSLFQPVDDILKAEPSIDQLVIIPDGILSYLPFEVLIRPGGKGRAGDFSKADFLGRRYRISYSISATQLHQSFTAPPKYGERAFVAFAPVFSDASNTNFLVNTTERSLFATDTATRAFVMHDRILPIPHSEDEVVTIRDLFTKRNLFAKYFIFRDAKEESLKDVELGGYKYIHLATHGVVNDRYPELSALLLAQDTTGGHDGILYAGEIYGLQWNAELVTLSACETGLGQIAEGEGILGLTRGFIYAGARNLLVSLWKVSDASTSQLMIDFYNNLLSGSAKPQALQKAKAKLIASKKFDHPYYWAPFILVGN